MNSGASRMNTTTRNHEETDGSAQKLEEPLSASTLIAPTTSGDRPEVCFLACREATASAIT